MLGFAPRLVSASSAVAPLLSVVTIALLCSSIIGQSADASRASAPGLLAALNAPDHVRRELATFFPLLRRSFRKVLVEFGGEGSRPVALLPAVFGSGAKEPLRQAKAPFSGLRCHTVLLSQ